MTDDIMEELWRTRDALAENHGHDLDKIVAAIRRREQSPLTGMCDRLARHRAILPDKDSAPSPRR